MGDADKQSIWKKEITLRRKPKEKGVRVPPAPESRAKPDSVAELLRPIAEQPLEPVVLPPVTPAPLRPSPAPSGPALPPVSTAPPSTPPEPEPQAPSVPEPQPVGWDELEPDGQPEPEGEPLEPAAPDPIVLSAAPETGIAAEAETVADAPAPKPSRRQRKQAKRETKRLEEERKRREKHLAKEERRSAPSHHKRLVGLKIGASQLAAAQIVNSSAARGSSGWRGCRSSAASSSAASCASRRSSSRALKTFFRKNKLPQNAVRLGISNNRIGVRSFEISGIDDPKQLANAIRFRAQETLPIPLDEAVLDYRILDERIGEDGVRTLPRPAGRRPPRAGRPLRRPPAARRG